jgi:8-oxo-dGTP pyrophosphatase MutT (NUDIX family)
MTQQYNNPWKTLSKKSVYSNPWIEVHHSEVRTPTGSAGIYGTIHFKNKAIGIIPIDEAGNTWLVGQYRYALEAYSWEIPEGGGLHHIDPLEAARKELAEEVGLKAERWDILAELNTSNSVTDEYGIIYVARELSPAYAPLDDTEVLQVRKLPLQEAIRMALDGEIKDSISLIGLMKVSILQTQNRL